MRSLLSLLVLITFSTVLSAQQPLIHNQDDRVAIPNQTIHVADRETIMPYDTSPCPDVDPVFFLRVEDVFSITGVGTIALGDVLEGKAIVPTDVAIVDAAMFWNVMLSYPKGLNRYNSLVALRESPTFTRKTVLTSIEQFRQQPDAATKGMVSVGISLRGVAVADVGRGHYIFGLNFPERFSECSCPPENSSSYARRPRQD